MIDYGKTFALWRDAAGQYWPAYTQHRFVQGLGDGSLPRAAFLDYMVQDYLFLVHFSRAWALAVTKADTADEMRLCAGTVNALINDEMALHIRTCANLGLTEAALFEAEEKLQNIAYTRYVLDAGHSGDLLDLLAALAPCVMGYGEIGAQLTDKATSDSYADWIATYASEDYQQVCRDVGALLDAAVTRRLGPAPQDSPRWPALCHRFTTATRLEVGFWDMGLEEA